MEDLACSTSQDRFFPIEHFTILLDLNATGTFLEASFQDKEYPLTAELASFHNRMAFNLLNLQTIDKTLQI